MDCVIFQRVPQKVDHVFCCCCGVTVQADKIGYRACGADLRETFARAFDLRIQYTIIIAGCKGLKASESFFISVMLGRECPKQ
jgi:hypothetical protein